MDEKQKARMEVLKKQSQIKMREKQLLNNVLYQEAIEALQDYCVIQDEFEKERIIQLVSYNDKEMHTHDEKINLVDGKRYFIVWDNEDVPVIESDGKCINNCWDDVIAVSFDTYFVSKMSGEVIGIRH